MKSFALRTLWLGGQAFDGVLWLWYVSIPILIFFCLAVVWLIRSKRTLSPAIKALILLAVAGCFGILFMASVWHWDVEWGYHPEQTERPLNILSTFAILSLALSLLLVGFARGQRIAATAIALPGIWFGFWCFFVAVMAISGQWL
jgi:hypothetical protein